MLCFRDHTFCASPNCNNACGRKMNDREVKEREEFIKNNNDGFNLPISYGYFCGEPENIDHA